MDIEQCLDFIHRLQKFGKKSGLRNITQLLYLLGNPQDKLKFIHVAGTNGKGSVSSYISNIFTSAKYKTGLFISPYIEKFNERIQINSKGISDDDLIRLTLKVKEKIEILNQKGIYPIEFEVICAIAFMYYLEQSCDIVVLETGVGGLYDCTNIIKSPQMCVITEIGFDHTKYLGNTIKEIAAQKGGIIKEGSVCTLYPKLEEDALLVLKECAKNKNAVIKIPNLENLNIKKSGIYGSVFDYGDILNIETSLVGHHQILNALTAIESVLAIRDKWNITNINIKEGIKNSKWKCRFEVFFKKPLFVLDGAHNQSGVKALKNTINSLWKNKNIIFVMGMLEDKDYKNSIDEIFNIPKEFIVTKVPSTRQHNADLVFEHVKKYRKDALFIEDNFEAINYAVSKSNDDFAVIIFGSLYLCGNVRGFVENF